MAALTNLIKQKKESDTLYGKVTGRASARAFSVDAGGRILTALGDVPVAADDAVIVQKVCGVWHIVQKLGQAEKAPEVVYV